MTRKMSTAMAAVAAAGLVAGSPRLGAQEIPPPAVALIGGAFRYDLDGIGTEPFVALRLDLPMATWLYLEPSFGYVTYTSRGGSHIRHLTAEVQVQGSMPFGRWHPYLGGGAGGFFDLRKQRAGADFVQPTVSGSGGVRFTLPRGLGVRAELRVRGMGEHFAGSATEWSGGISKSF